MSINVIIRPTLINLRVGTPVLSIPGKLLTMVPSFTCWTALTLIASLASASPLQSSVLERRQSVTTLTSAQVSGFKPQGGGGNKIAHMTYIFAFKVRLNPPSPPLLPYTVVIYPYWDCLVMLSKLPGRYRLVPIYCRALPVSCTTSLSLGTCLRRVFKHEKTCICMK